MLVDKIMDVLNRTHGDGMATDNLSDIANWIVEEVQKEERCGLTFDMLREANVRRCTETFLEHNGLDGWSPAEWMNAALGELGEMANVIKKGMRGEGWDLHKIAIEGADTVTYIDLAMARMRLNLGTAVGIKFNVVSRAKRSPVTLPVPLNPVIVQAGAELIFPPPKENTGTEALLEQLFHAHRQAMSTAGIKKWDPDSLMGKVARYLAYEPPNVNPLAPSGPDGPVLNSGDLVRGHSPHSGA